MSKHILITGSTDGIGKLTAINLAKQGHTLYLHGRNPDKLAKVIDEVKEQSGSEQVAGFVADLSTIQGAKQLAEQASELSQLDVLINNAGVFKTGETNNAEGQDLRFVVNYFAPYLLTQALLPLLAKSTDGRVINLSSAAQAPVSIAALNGQTSLAEGESYAQSKLALTMWSFYLAQQQSKVAVIAVNPGSLLNTNMVRDAFGKHWASADKGADILCQLAVGAEHKSKSGQYFDNDQGDWGKAHPSAYNAAGVTQLIQATESLLAAN